MATVLSRPVTHSLVGLGLACTVALLAGCDMGKLTVNTTSKVLARAQPSIKMESDYELAARAMPGTLKTVEGFWVVNPDNEKLTAILMEGYCQYGTGFVEDEWEIADIAKDFDRKEELSARATKMFVRCMNYALSALGKKWQEGIFGEFDQVKKLVDGAGGDERNALMWAAIGLGSTINQNKDKPEIFAMLPVAKMMLEKVAALDAKNLPSDPAFAALPQIALGMLNSATSTQLGGDPKKAEAHFMKALELTGDKFLLARVLYARRVGVMTQNRKLFHDNLVKVLQTAPSVWPEQRLANEVAHRRARRYLKIEKELF
jgi:hypothetical protein